MIQGNETQLGFNTNGGYDTGAEQFGDRPIPLSEKEMAEHGILDTHRAMTGETAKQWGSAGMRRREEAASQPQSDGSLPGIDEMAAAEKESDALEAYSREKNIPAAVLRESLGCYAKGEALTIPYYDEQGQQRAARLRHGQGHDPRFSWLPKSDIIPYGLWLRLNQGSGAIVLAEGESDAQSLWMMGIPCLGIPGATLFKSEWARQYLKDRPLWLHHEGDAGGDAFLRLTAQRLKEAGHTAPLWLIRARDIDPRCKDISDLYLLRGKEEARDLLRTALKKRLPLETAEAASPGVLSPVIQHSEFSIQHSVQATVSAENNGFASAQQTLCAGESRPFATASPPAASSLPAFPIDSLPQFGQAIVREVSASIQVPQDLAACFMLGAISACCVGKVQVEPWEGYQEPIQVYILGSANPSERKSPAMAALFRPIYEYQRKENERRAPLIRRYLSEREGAEMKVKRAVLKGNKGDIDAAHKELEEIHEIKPFELIVSDATTEALAQCMARNDGKAALVSAEGGMLGTLCGRYASQQMANVDVILHGYSGEPMSQHRIARGQLDIRRAALSLCLAAQPGVVQRFLTHEAMLECGMVSRFLVASPSSGLGSRLVQGPPMNPGVMAAWDGRLFDLLCWESPVTLKMTEKAAEAYNAWGLEVENRLRPEGDLHDLAGGFGGKLRGNTARIAGLLYILEVGLGPTERRIHGRHMRGAIEIARYFTAHMLALCGAEDLSPEADAVLKVLRRCGVATFTQTFLRRKLNGRRGLDTTDAVAKAIEELLVEEFIFIDTSARPALNNRGRPAGLVYRLKES